MISIDSWQFGLSVAVMAAGFWINSLLHRVSREEKDDVEFAARIAEMQAIALAKSAPKDYPPMPDEYFIQHVSKGRDNYGQVLESVRVTTGHRVPTMPRPAPTARCQWCRVKLTNGACVDGCGGHQ